MNKLILSLCAVVAFGSAAFAGPERYSGKEMKQSVAPAPCPQWYADNEFNVSLWGTYAFTGTEWRNDTYLGVDHAWGGGLDAKYFFHKYFGIGAEGSILRDNTYTLHNGVFATGSDDDRTVGTILGTLTFRFPIACTRYAPYFWMGGGGIFGGGRAHDFVLDPAAPFGIVRRDFPKSDSKLVGQVGGGLEIRFTPHMGLLNDFSWNIISGSRNNYGMARSGLNFAF